jgi:hypothetical protein
VDGTGERQVLSGLKQARGPDWAPDAKRIVLNYQHEGRLLPERVGKPYTKSDPGIPWNAGDIGVSVGAGGINLCWTLPPDPHWGLSVVDLATGKADDLYAGMYAFRPAWDPTQPWRIVSEAGNGLVETSVNRDHQQYLTNNVSDKAPVISPDGRYMAVTFNNNGPWDIYRLNSDGSGRVRLTDMPIWTQVGPERQPAWNNVSPAWSPDGSQIGFLTDRAGRWEIWVMNADGSNQHPLFPADVNARLNFKYDFNDEKVLNWR